MASTHTTLGYRCNGTAKRALGIILIAWLMISGGAVHGAEPRAPNGETPMSPGYQIARGVIDGARWVLALPEPPLRGLLVFNHGYRTEAQRLSAEVDFETEPFASAIAAGYAVTASSFRRNGWIVCDAVTDTEVLIEEIARRHGPFEHVLVAGESMGGAVSLRMLEREPGRYAGALILGDGLFSTDEGEPRCPGLNGAVADPVLVLVNRSEAAGPRRYVESIAGEAPKPPVLWVVERDGHVNFNGGELATAFAALNGWTNGDERPAPKVFAITATPESSAVFEGCCAASAAVRSVDPNFGNLTTAFTEHDLERMGIAVGVPFELAFRGATVRVRRVSTYGEVQRGRWLALIDGDGYLQIAINYDDAAAALGVATGDILRIAAVREEGDAAAGAETAPAR